MNQTITLPRAVVEQAQMWIPLLAEMAGMDPETTTAEFSEFADGRPASEFTIANVITALRAALEQPQNHVPDAGNMVPTGWKLVPVEPTKEMLLAFAAEFSVCSQSKTFPTAYRAMLAAAPQPPTTEDCSVVQPQGEQEPVAWIRGRELEMLKLENGGCATVYASDSMINHSQPLYTHSQPKREPLTDEQIVQVLGNVREQLTGNVFLAFARAIERAHGIGGEE